MNSLIRKAAFFLSGSLAFLLVSCLDVEQEFWIHADGSGRIKVSNKVPTEAIEAMTELQKGLADALGAEAVQDERDPYGLEEQKKELEANRYVKSVVVASTADDDFTTFSYDIQVSDMTRAHEILEVLFESVDSEEPGAEQPADLEKLFTAVRISKERHGIYRLSADLGEARGRERTDDPADELSREIARGFFGDMGVTILVHGASVKSGEKAPTKSEEWTAKIADLVAGETPAIDALVAGFKSPPADFPPGGAAPSIKLTDTSGKTIEVSVLAATDEEVRIRLIRNRRQYTIPRTKLSDQSNLKIDEWKRSRAKR